jgi:hypothetical protein
MVNRKFEKPSISAAHLRHPAANRAASARAALNPAVVV